MTPSLIFAVPPFNTGYGGFDTSTIDRNPFLRFG